MQLNIQIHYIKIKCMQIKRIYHVNTTLFCKKTTKRLYKACKLKDNNSKDYSMHAIKETIIHQIKKIWSKILLSMEIDLCFHILAHDIAETFEPPPGKTNNLHRRKQRRRSASQ